MGFDGILTLGGAAVASAIVSKVIEAGGKKSMAQLLDLLAVLAMVGIVVWEMFDLFDDLELVIRRLG